MVLVSGEPRCFAEEFNEVPLDFPALWDLGVRKSTPGEQEASAVRRRDDEAGCLAGPADQWEAIYRNSDKTEADCLSRVQGMVLMKASFPLLLSSVPDTQACFLPVRGSAALISPSAPGLCQASFLLFPLLEY